MIQPESIISLILSLWLILCSLQDISKKKISTVLIGVGFIILLICTSVLGNLTVMDRFAGLSLGIILLALCPITRGQIGLGDGIIVCITGLSIGFIRNTMLLMYALVGSAVFSAVLIIFWRVNRHKTIPFIPFVFIGYLGVLLFE